MARREGARTKRTLLWLVLLVVFTGYLIWALRAEEAFQVANKKLEYTDAGVVVSGGGYGTPCQRSAITGLPTPKPITARPPERT